MDNKYFTSPSIRLEHHLFTLSIKSLSVLSAHYFLPGLFLLPTGRRKKEIISATSESFAQSR